MPTLLWVTINKQLEQMEQTGQAALRAAGIATFNTGRDPATRKRVMDSWTAIMEWLTVGEETLLACTSRFLNHVYDTRWYYITQRMKITWGMTHDAVTLWKSVLADCKMGMCDIRRHLRLESLREDAEACWVISPDTQEEKDKRARWVQSKKRRYPDE